MTGNMHRSISQARRTLSGLSLRNKLLLIISGVSFIVVGFFMASSFAIELNVFKKRLLDGYCSTTQILANNLEAALAFGDEEDSRELVGNVSRLEAVNFVAVYFSDGRLLALYRSKDLTADDPIPDLSLTTGIVGSYLYVKEPVFSSGEISGYVILKADMREANAFFLSRIWRSVVLLIFSLFIGVALAVLLSKRISRPILALARTAQRISVDHDFSTRQKRVSEDEVGKLVDAFNEMMAEIETRDDKIRSSEQRFRGYFELGIVGAGVLNTRLRWEDANVRMLEMLECTIDALKGHSFLEILDLTPSSLTIEHFDIIEESGRQIKIGDYWFKRKGKSSIYVMMSMRLVPGTRLTEPHIILLAQDITDRKLYEDKLKSAKEEAEASSKAKDEFLSIISHELRTPLNPIIGYVKMLQHERDAKEDPVRLSYIKQSAQHLLGLIDNLLDYSRIERGSIQLNVEDVDFIGIVKDVVGLLSPAAVSKGLEVSSNFAMDGVEEELRPIVRLDPLKFKQILFNLISNATKFTEVGSVNVTSRLVSLEDGMARIRIEITDTGIGISDSDREKVMTPFAQVDGSMSRVYGGMGLGVAISRRMMKAMGGSLDFRSELGVGSRFWIEMDVKFLNTRKEVDASESLIEGVSAPAVMSAGGNGRRVLLVEDDLLNRELAFSLLVSAGYSVVTARDGVEALDRIKVEEFDLIVMDLRMPRLDGYETAKVIRKFERGRKHVPIVAVSAHVTSEDRQKCFAVGMDGYLSKPLDIERFNTLLEQWMN